MKNIVTIAKRELWYYLNTPTAYIVTVAFLIPINFLFWRNVLISNEASLRGFFSLLPWFMLLVIPALTMRVLSEEQRKHTLELLLSHAIQEWQIIVGKFLGVWAFYALILAVTLTIPLTLFTWGHPELGIILGQYVGALFMGAALIAMGVLVSTWFTQAVTAFLAAAGIGFIWYLLGLDIVTLAVPWPFNQIVHQIALLPHVDQLARGAIELRDLGYFVSVTGVLLALAAIKLSETKLMENPLKRSQLYTAALIIAGIGVAANLVFTSWPLRLDLTSDQRFTLSSGTRNTLNNLPDIVSITVYASRNLPAPVQLVRRDIEDILKDYARLGKGKIKVAFIDPEDNPSETQKASQAGVTQIQFNTIGNSKFEVAAGYLGMVINYGDKQETIGYVQDPGNLEYDLTQRIRKLNSDKQTKLAFLDGHGEKNLFQDLSNWSKDLETQFQTSTLTLDAPDSKIDADLVIIPGPTEALDSTASAKLKEFLNNNGKILALIDGVSANPQLGVANELNTGINELLTDYGLQMNKDLVYDVQLNEQIRLGSGLVQYIIPYPFWIRTLPVEDSLQVPEGVLLGWATSVTINPKEGITAKSLLQTSQAGGKQEGTFTIAPDTAPKQGQGKELVVAASAEKGNGRVILVGDSELATNDFYQNSPANQVFLSTAIDWLVVDEAQGRVARRQIIPALMKFTAPSQALAAQYGNMLGVPVLVGAFGFWWLRRRNNLTRRMYRI